MVETVVCVVGCMWASTCEMPAGSPRQQTHWRNQYVSRYRQVPSGGKNSPWPRTPGLDGGSLVARMVASTSMFTSTADGCYFCSVLLPTSIWSDCLIVLPIWWEPNGVSAYLQLAFPCWLRRLRAFSWVDCPVVFHPLSLAHFFFYWIVSLFLIDFHELKNIIPSSNSLLYMWQISSTDLWRVFSFLYYLFW